MARTDQQRPVADQVKNAIEPPGAGRAALSFVPPWWPVIFLACLGLIFAYLLYFSYLVQLDYYDSYEVLLNAKRVVYRLPEIYYRTNRTPLSALLYAPLFAIERLLGITGFAVRASHIYALAYFAAFLAVVYRLFRSEFSKPLACLGVLLLALNPILIHYSPMARDDIPGAFFTALAFYWYLRAGDTRQIRDYVLTGLFVALAIGTRYNLPPLMFSVIAAYELLTGQTKFRRGGGFWMKVGLLFVVPCVLFFLFAAIAYASTGRSSFWEAPVVFVQDVLHITKDQERFGITPPVLNYIFLAKSVTIPVLALAVLGIGLFLRRWPGRSLFFFLWLVTFFIFQTEFVGHKESRYLLVLLPPLYYFAVGAIGWLAECVPLSAALRVVAVLGLLALPVTKTVHEFVCFTDPVYYVNFEREVSDFASKLAGPHDIAWAGVYYPIFPKDYVFDDGDDYTSIYHMGAHVVEFYLNRRVYFFPKMSLDTPSHHFDRIIYDNPTLSSGLRDGDVLICNMQHYMRTSTVEELWPLIVQLVHVDEFKSDLSATAGKGVTYQSAQHAGARVHIVQGLEGFDLAGDGLPEGPSVLYVCDNEKRPLGLVQLDVKNGSARQFVPQEEKYRRPLGTIRLVRTTTERFFLPPTRDPSAGTRQAN